MLCFDDLGINCCGTKIFSVFQLRKIVNYLYYKEKGEPDLNQKNLDRGPG
jgi:hypothetical protein